MLEFSLVDSIHVVKHTVAMHQTFPKLTLVFELFVGPLESAFSMIQAIFKFSCVAFSILFLEHSGTLNYIRKHLSLVNTADLFFAICKVPCQLASSMHLGIDKLTNVVSAIWPLEFTKTLNL